ncbi:MAG: NAD-dependent deacetylase [Anaerolineae bacterium]
MSDLDFLVNKASDLIRRARRVVALTGAGISTPSGIPDFRSPTSGLWNQANPMTVASIIGFQQRPQDFYEWVRPLTKIMLSAQPNPAHYALAELEAAGKLTGIITQNIDGLHQAAGSKNVYEVHGHTREATCMHCHEVHPAEEILHQFVEDAQIPVCHCGGVLKPNVILFGEQLPVQVLLGARAEVQQCDLLIIAGSSLEVAPVSELPLEALDHQARVIIVNYQPTHIDRYAKVVIQDDVAEVLPRMVELVSV